jgi:hypothetical protein
VGVGAGAGAGAAGGAAAAGAAGDEYAGGRPALKRKKSDEAAAFSPAELAPIPLACVAKNVLPPPEPGCTLRSALLAQRPTLPPGQDRQLEVELTNVGVRKIKTLFPSAAVAALYNTLRQDLVTLINLHAHVQQRELERDTLRARLRGEPLGAPPAAAAAAGAAAAVAAAAAAAAAGPSPSPQTPAGLPAAPSPTDGEPAQKRLKLEGV